MLIIASFIILQALIFAGVVVFLRQMFSQNVTSATAHLDKMSLDYAKKEEEIKKQYEEATRKSQEIVLNAQKELQAQKEQAFQEAQEEKKRLLEAAQAKADELIAQADRAAQGLLKEMAQKIEEKALLKAVGLLQRILPEGIRFEIHKKWFDDLIASGLSRLERLNIPEGIDTASVITPFTLSSPQKEALLKVIGEKLGRQIMLVEKIDPNIIAGLVVMTGNLVFDGSLRFKIEEAARGEQSGG